MRLKLKLRNKPESTLVIPVDVRTETPTEYIGFMVHDQEVQKIVMTWNKSDWEETDDTSSDILAE